MSLQVHLYQGSGFCSGVRQAIRKALKLAEEKDQVYTLGPLVHNREVEQYLEDRGVFSVDDPSEGEKGSTLLIRTHGVGPKTRDFIASREGIELQDATCPRVQKVQQLAEEAVNRGAELFLWGKKEHPEVQGIVECSGGKARVVLSWEELKKKAAEVPSHQEAVLLSQTTQDQSEFEQAASGFTELFPQGVVHDTICDAVKTLQEEAVRLAQRVEVMVVFGSSYSSNTEKLVRMCRKHVPTYRVSHAGELEPDMFKHIKEVGVIAGASTPDWIIKEVVEMMEDERMGEGVNQEEQPNQETEEEVEENLEQQEAEEEESQQDEGQETGSDQPDFSYQDVQEFEVGEKISGKVAQVDDDHVLVDIGYKTEAVLPRSEVYLEEGSSLRDKFSLEMEIEVAVLRLNEEEGSITVSHRRMEKEKYWSALEKAYENEEVLEGRVKEVVDAGVIIDLGAGIEGFMPGSLVDAGYIPDFNVFLDETLTFKIIEMNRERNKVILSRKKVMEEEAEQKKQDALDQLEEGSVVKGTVKRLTEFGAFVDVGDIDGLVHISEISWERVEHPADVLEVGQEVDVKVLEVIPEKERVSLSIRKAQPDPWDEVSSKFGIGDIIEGKVTRLVNFGVFVELMPGVEGLVHISQVADHHVKHPSEVVKEGDKIKVKILDLRPQDKRISLSIKDAFTPPPAPEKDTGSGSEEEESGTGVKLGDVFGDLFPRSYTESGQQEEDSARDNEESEEIEGDSQEEDEEPNEQ